MADEDRIRFYRGRSMAGSFRPGDCLTLEPGSLTDIRSGDVVVYRGLDHKGTEDKLVQRVMAAVPGGLVVRGENNPYTDTTPVTTDNLLGRVMHVERDGKTHRVRGGRLGLLRARVLRARRRVGRREWRLVVRVGRKPYRWLRESGLVPRLWRPSVLRVCLVTENGPLVKYVCSGRTVARWWPAEGRFECQKLYGLVLRREDLPVERNAG